MKASTISALFVAAISLSLPACSSSHAEEHEARHDQHTIVATSPVSEDVTITQRYVCQIHSQRNIEISARAFGILEEIEVREGQTVKEGDVMFKIIPTLYQARYATEMAEAKLARLKRDNTKRLFDSNVVSIQELNIAEAELEKANSKLKASEAELNFATVKAPFDGIIGRQMKQQGSTLKEGEVLTVLSDNSTMRVYFNVPEVRDLEFMAELGQNCKRDPQAQMEALVAELNRTAKIELLLANGSKYPEFGKLVSMLSTVNNETGNRSYRADFANPDRLLRHGQTGTVLIKRTLKGAIVIPQRATFERLDKRYVYIIGADSAVHEREIAVAHEMDDIFVIRHGVDVHDKIILEGVRQVHDGEKVEYEFHDPKDVLAHLKKHAE